MLKHRINMSCHALPHYTFSEHRKICHREKQTKLFYTNSLAGQSHNTTQLKMGSRIITRMALTAMKHPIHALKLDGSITSTISISLEKRFTMRPIGVMSKKDIGLRKMFLSSILCRYLAARTVAPAIVKAPHMMNNAAE